MLTRTGRRLRLGLKLPGMGLGMLTKSLPRSRPGTAPGTIRVSPDAPDPIITLIAYGPNGFVREIITSVADIDRVRGEYPTIWVNIDGLGDAELLNQLAERFNIHRLALEDVVNVTQRAKLETYDHQLFVVARMVSFRDRSLVPEQISLFVGEGYVLSFQERAGDSFDLVRQRIESGKGLIRRCGADYLAYALLDAMIDGYFPVLETYGDHLESLESEVLANPRQEQIGIIHSVKRQLLGLRRASWPHREMLAALMRDDVELVTPETRVHLRDVYDHTIQVLDMIETFREVSSGLLDIYLSQVSNRMNEVMKVLTIFAAIFIPLTFVAGLYGMNFDHMPELHWRWSYPVLLIVMVVMALGLVWFFHRKGWIGSGSSHPFAVSENESPDDER